MYCGRLAEHLSARVDVDCHLGTIVRFGDRNTAVEILFCYLPQALWFIPTQQMNFLANLV